MGHTKEKAVSVVDLAMPARFAELRRREAEIVAERELTQMELIAVVTEERTLRKMVAALRGSCDSEHTIDRIAAGEDRLEVLKRLRVQLTEESADYRRQLVVVVEERLLRLRQSTERMLGEGGAAGGSMNNHPAKKRGAGT